MTSNEKQPPLGVYKCKELIHDIFLQSGQKDLLMAHIRHKTTQQGWTWTMRDEFIDYIKKRGTDNVNVSHMITDLAVFGREHFPTELKKELVESIYEVTKNYFTIDDDVTPLTDPDNAHSEPERTFLFQSKDIKPDPGLGIGVDPDESPPPSPQSGQSSTSASSTPRQSPGPITVTTPPVPRQSPIQNNPRQSPGSAPRQSPVNSAPRPLTPQPLPPPPILRPETGKSETVEATEDEEQDEDDDEDNRNNEEDEEDELMDV